MLKKCGLFDFCLVCVDMPGKRSCRLKQCLNVLFFFFFLSKALPEWLLKACEDLSKEHEVLYTVPCTFKPHPAVVKDDESMAVQCEICDVRISAGPLKQRLSNLRRHFTESSSHKSKVILAGGRENVSSESVAEMEVEDSQKLAFLASFAPGVFRRNDSVITCLYCPGPGNTILLHPTHGSFQNNIRSHVQSKQHERAARDGKKQGTLDSLFGKAFSPAMPERK